MKLRLITLAFISVFFLTAASAKKKTTAPVNDRQQWVELCYRIAAPVLENMSKGELQKNMQLELSPTWDGRDKRVAYMETFGRLMAGISPWLASRLGWHCLTMIPKKERCANRCANGLCLLTKMP